MLCQIGIFTTLNELLRSYSCVRSTDVEELCDAASKLTTPFKVDPYPQRTRGVTVYNSLDLGAVAFSYVHLEMPVRVRQDPIDSALFVRFPLAGTATDRRGNEEKQFSERTAAVFEPGTPFDLEVAGSSRALLLRVHRSALHSELNRILGRPFSRRLSFDWSLDLNTPQASSWLSILRALCLNLDAPDGINHPALHLPIQRLVITQLLTTLRHSASDELADPVTPEAVEPRVIRRAEQLIVDHCRELLTVSDIAEAVSVSVRTLQNGFRRYLDTTPSERLRQARLAGVHAELLASDPSSVKVRKVASDWGLHHHGRFSQWYITAYGETPSQTLRR